MVVLLIKRLLITLTVLICIIGLSINSYAFSVSAKSAALIEVNSGDLIYGKNENEKKSMASTTKIMTALLAIEAGADDMEVEDGEMLVYTAVEDFLSVKQALEDSGVEISSAELSKIPNNTIEITDVEQGKLLVKMMEMLDDNDDVQNVYHNWEMPDEE